MTLLNSSNTAILRITIVTPDTASDSEYLTLHMQLHKADFGTKLQQLLLWTEQQTSMSSSCSLNTAHFAFAYCSCYYSTLQYAQSSNSDRRLWMYKQHNQQQHHQFHQHQKCHKKSASSTSTSWAYMIFVMTVIFSWCRNSFRKQRGNSCTHFLRNFMHYRCKFRHFLWKFKIEYV